MKGPGQQGSIVLPRMMVGGFVSSDAGLTCEGQTVIFAQRGWGARW